MNKRSTRFRRYTAILNFQQAVPAVAGSSLTISTLAQIFNFLQFQQNFNKNGSQTVLSVSWLEI